MYKYGEAKNSVYLTVIDAELSKYYNSIKFAF